MVNLIYFEVIGGGWIGSIAMTQHRAIVAQCLLVYCIAPSAFATGLQSQLPTPGCYQVDWAATNIVSAGGQPRTRQVATIDGATGDYRLVMTPVGGQSIVQEQAGRGPYLRDFRPNVPIVAQNCPALHTDNGQGTFDFKMACETFWVDPGRLTFTKLQGPFERWQITAQTAMTSQVGFNSLPTAMAETLAGMDTAIANAAPKNEAERQQIQQARQGLARARQQARENAPAVEATRQALEARRRTAPAEEQAGIRAALDGVATTHTTIVVETWTPTTLPCGS
jgi:hypothetical protein